MLILNSADLLDIAMEEIEAAVNEQVEDYEIVNRVKGVVGFIHRVRDKEDEKGEK